jgi:hypothetical protein
VCVDLKGKHVPLSEEEEREVQKFSFRSQRREETKREIESCVVTSDERRERDRER